MMAGMGRPKSVWHDLPPRMSARRLKKGIRYYYQAAGKKIPLGANLMEAKEEWARLERSGPRLTLPKVSKLYQATDEYKGFSLSTKDHYGRALRVLEVHFRKSTLEQIQPRHVKNWLRKRTKKGAAMFEKRVLSAVFNWARGEGLTSAPNPCAGIKFSRAEKRTFEPMGRRKIHVADAAYRACYERGDAVLRDAMDLAYLTGQRPSDVLKARWADIVDGVLWVEQQKTGKRVGITVEGELLAVIERLKARPVAGLTLVADRRGQRVLYGALNRRHREARGDDTWQFRDIRARTATDSDSLKAAQELLGHENERTTAAIYRRAKGSVVPPLKRRI